MAFSVDVTVGFILVWKMTRMSLLIVLPMRDFADNSNGPMIVYMYALVTDVFNLFYTVYMLHEGRLIYIVPALKSEQ